MDICSFANKEGILPEYATKNRIYDSFDKFRI